MKTWKNMKTWKKVLIVIAGAAISGGLTGWNLLGIII